MKNSLTSLSVFILLVVVLSGCEQEIGNGPAIEGKTQGTIIVEEAFPQLTFEMPVDFQHAGDNSNRVFVVEQKKGIISVFQNDPAVEEKSVFLDIEEFIEETGTEQGLLGLAFHPDYENNGYFYINYTSCNPRPDRTIIARYQVSASDPNKADENSEFVLLELDQPYSNHNGGQLSFGPDGYLYIALGDGGSGGDPHENGQNLQTLLGSLLRIDVDNTAGEENYAIPSDNPFANNSEGYREEIYAYGLRNPWRFSFDSETNRLWLGDVGQNAYEEIDIIEKGGNYGWNTMEGFHCFDPPSDCDQDGLELPIWEYDRSEGDVAVTGGFVYRGPTIAPLEGFYVYADYASGRIWTLNPTDLDNPVNTELLQAPFQISSFGTDQDNELYICGHDDGKIYRFGFE